MGRPFGRGALRGLLGALALLVLAVGAAAAHEVRPALLQIIETRPHAYEVMWKQPMVGDLAVHLEPHLSGGLIDRPPDSVDTQPGFRIKIWRLRHVVLDGRVITIEGLSQSVTDVLVRVAPIEGAGINGVIRPADPTLILSLAAPSGLAVPAYLRMGVEHILTGFDHLLFVFGLFLLVGPSWRLVKAITAFTAAHTLTLGLAALGYIRFPSAVIEALVALSIVFLACELATGDQRATRLAYRRPWVIAFTFGLLHGLAFAGALAEVGLPRGQAPQALFMFNVGVEIGQLSFIGVIVGISALLGRTRMWRRAQTLPLAAQAPAYAVGALSAYWLIERIVAAVTPVA